jgi:hypothetical protein
MTHDLTRDNVYGFQVLKTVKNLEAISFVT